MNVMTTPDTETEVRGEEKPFFDHLRDLRVTIIQCLAALTIGILVALPATPRLLDMVEAPLQKAGKDPDSFLVMFRVVEPFSITMKFAFWCGLILSLPLVLYFIARFVFPGLLKKERKAVLWSLGAGAVLFAAGIGMGYVITLPVALKVMFRIGEWLGKTPPFIELSNYVSFSLRLLVAFGCAFELPVVVLALGRLDLVSSSWLRGKRRHVIVGLMVLAMLLTPSDPYTMLLMALPLVALYEICIWIIWGWERKKI